MTPRLLIFRSLWTNDFALARALADVRSGSFDGVEGPVPAERAERATFIATLQAAGTPFIAEVTTGGGYVPASRSPAVHLADWRRKLDQALEATPRFVTALAGCDAWPLDLAVDFLGRALELARERDLVVSFETHRSRPTFNPWATLELLRQLPALRLTCDFSHWCCVCERLVLDDEPELLAEVAGRAHHLHARVGYAQGPQVPHPAAPEHREALAAHERWWDRIAAARPSTAGATLTITPEFGPDGYLQCQPFSRRAVADLDEINHWMAGRLRDRYGVTPAPAVSGSDR